MKRLLTALRWEMTLQLRNGFYGVTLFILALCVLLFTQIPADTNLNGVLPGILMGNLEITTFYFMAGLVLLEKGEGTLEARVVTPLRTREYLAARVISLVLLAIAENLILALMFSRLQLNPLPVILGVGLAAAIFALAGFLAVVHYDSINEFMFPSMFFTLLVLLPLVDFFGLVKSPLFLLHPMQAALTLMRGGWETLSIAEWIYGMGYSALWLGGLFYGSIRAFRKFVIAREGVHA